MSTPQGEAEKMSVAEISAEHREQNGSHESSVKQQEDHTPSSGEDIAPEVIGGELADLPIGYYRSANFIGTIVALCLGSVSSYLGWVLPSNLLLVINADIGPDDNFIWMAVTWTLAFSVCALLWGRLSDIFGRRWFFIWGNACCLIGAIMGSVAQNMTTLILANVFVGLANPAQLGFTIAIAELIPNKWRGYTNALFFCASLPFAVFGPVIARAFVTNTAAGWRWPYYLNVITTTMTLICFYFFYHPPKFDQLHTRHSKIQIIKKLDYVGILLFTAGLTIFLLGINWGGTQYPWASGATLGTLLGGLALLVLLAFWEIYGAKDPLIPMHFFLNRGYIGIIICAAAGSMIYYSLNVLFPQQITVMYTTDQIQIGWMSCAVGGSTLLGQLIGGGLVKVLRRQKWQMVVCAVLMTAFIGGMAATTQHTPRLAVALTCLGSIFVGYIELVALTTAPLCVDDKDIGVATGVLGSVRTGLAGVALSIYSTVLANKVAENVPKYVTAAATEAGLDASAIPDLIAGLSGTGALDAVSGLNDEILAAAMDAFQTAYSKSFQVVYLISISFGGLAVIAALCSPNLEGSFSESISRKMNLDHIGNRGKTDEKGVNV